MQVSIRPFDIIGNTVNLAVLATTANVQVTGPGIGYRTVRIFNSGTNTVFINFGTSAVTASTSTSLPMIANSIETFYLHNDQTYVAAIAGSTGNTIYITCGEST